MNRPNEPHGGCSTSKLAEDIAGLREDTKQLSVVLAAGDGEPAWCLSVGTIVARLAARTGRATPAVEAPLTPIEAEALLARLGQHYGEPVQPVSRYCGAFDAWIRAMNEKKRRLAEMLWPHLHDAPTKEVGYSAETLAAHEAYKRETASGYVDDGWKELSKHPKDADRPEDRALMARLSKLGDHVAQERQMNAIYGVLTTVHKSNLLWRLIYGGERVREVPCPEHKGHWSGVGECPHGCDLTGWLPNAKESR